MASGKMASKTALVFMLLLAAVVATHGHKVACKNDSPATITANGIEILPDVTIIIDVDGVLKLEIPDKTGKIVKGSCAVPEDVTALVCLYVDAGIQVKVAGVTSVLGGLINTAVGLVLTILGIAL